MTSLHLSDAHNFQRLLKENTFDNIFLDLDNEFHDMLEAVKILYSHLYSVLLCCLLEFRTQNSEICSI